MAALSLQIIFIFTLLLTTSHFTYNLAQSPTYIIHMDSSAMPKIFADHHSWYLNTLSSISDNSNHIYTYSNSIHGFSATLSLSELESLKKSHGFISFTKDLPLKLHTTHTSEFLGLSSTSGSWPASNYGEDVIIGMVDTGIWPESESFNDEGMAEIPSRWKGKCVSDVLFNSSSCNKKIIGARFYDKGLIANKPVLNVSMNSVRDTDGHGTHTSSTAAGAVVKGASYFGYGTGTARGIAPKARIAVYKPVWRFGIFSSDVLAAMDDAIRDGVDILSLSFALAIDGIFLEDDTVAVATFAAVEKGVFVAASAGNSGPLYSTLINGAPWLTTVAAGTIDREFYGTLTLGNGVQIEFESMYPGNSSLSQKALVFLDGCESVAELKTHKKEIIVCKENLSVSTQVENSMAARVSAAVFITNISVSDYYTRSSFAAAFIGLHDGQNVIDYIKKSKNPRGSLEFQKTAIGGKIAAPRVDGYSARGPFPSCTSVLKPDLLAPGTLILASWSPNSSVAEIQSGELFSKFNLDSGTSMATPHVSGAAALIKKVHPDWSPAAIRSALMTTANALDNTQSPIKDAADRSLPVASPLDIGAGHINPNKALDPGLVYDAAAEDYVNLLCAMNYTAKQIRIITRKTRECAKNKSLDLNYPSFIAYFISEDSKNSDSDTKVVHEFQRTVTNVGEGKYNYTAKLTGMDGLKVNVEPKKLVFKKKYEKLSYKLRVEGPILLKEDVIQGSLSWVSDDGKYVVRSPLVATSIPPDTLN